MGVAFGCTSTSYDLGDGEGLKDEQGRPVGVEADPRPGEFDLESENAAEINREESVRDAIKDAER